MRDLSVAPGLRSQYAESTGRTRVDIKPHTRALLRDAYTATLNSNCGWHFCPGPDAHYPTPMATCAKCYASIMLRRALLQLGLITKREDGTYG